jgi:hypothetical protein
MEFMALKNTTPVLYRNEERRAAIAGFNKIR